MRKAVLSASQARFRTPLLAVGLVLVAALVLSACGSSSDNTSSSSSEGSGEASSAVSQAKAAVEAAEAPVTKWTGPTSSPTPAKGKSIYVINCGPPEGCQRLDTAAMEAIKAIGWQGTLLKTEGEVSEYSAAVRQAVDRHADGIVLDAVPPTVIAQAVNAAKEAGIPVVSNVSGATPPSSAANFKGGFFTEVDADNETAGKLAADWIISDTEGDADVGSFFTPDFPVLEKRMNAFKAEMAKCEGCKVYPPVTVPVTEWESEGPAAVAQFLRANPSVNYFFSTADAPVTYEAQGIATAGKTGQVPIVSTEGNAPNLEMIREGGPEVATAASPLEWDAWASIDQLNRAFAGEEPAKQWEPGGGGIPIKLISKNNLPEKTWSGDLDYKAEFEKLWSGGN